MLLSKNLPQVSKKFTPIYLPYPRHYATLGEMLKNQLIEVHRLFLKVTQVWWIVEFQPIKFVDMIAGKGSHQYRKNTNNWYTTDALGAIFAIFAIFTILDTFTTFQYFYNTLKILLQYSDNTLTILWQYSDNTLTILLQYSYNTLTILLQYSYNTLTIHWTLKATCGRDGR